MVQDNGVWDMRNEYTVLVGKLRGKCNFENTSTEWKIK
jgi:hypothetical protein